MTPGKGGQDVDGIPVFNTFHEAVEETGANTAMVFVPPRFAADSVLEAADAGIETIIAITEGIPAHDELRVYTHLERTPGVRLIGPNCPGVLSPGKANVGIIPAAFFKEGNVGVVSRSGTLTYQIGNELAQRGFGNSSIVGIGGDPVPGSSFIDVIELFEDDPETELIVMSGEIGGSAEEEAAEYIGEQRLQAGGRLHRGLHRAAGQDDGPRGRDRLRHRRHRPGEGRGARGQAACASGARRPRSRTSRSRSSAAELAACSTSTAEDGSSLRAGRPRRRPVRVPVQRGRLALPAGPVHPDRGRARARARELDSLIFFTSALGVIPTAALMGTATEELAERAGPGIGGLLNVTFGNFPELLIAFFALRAGLHEVVKASIIGSVLGNVLLVLGASMFVGGSRRDRQSFNRRAASSQATMLILAGRADDAGGLPAREGRRAAAARGRARALLGTRSRSCRWPWRSCC